MKILGFPAVGAAALGIGGPFLAAAVAVEVPTLAPVVVSATRVDEASLDLPVSIDNVGAEAIRQPPPQVNLSESLARVEGVVVQNW